MTYGCITLNKHRAVGQETSKTSVSIALSTVCGNHLIKKVGAHAQPGHIWRAFSEVAVTSCTVLRSSNAAGCAHQVLSSIYLTMYSTCKNKFVLYDVIYLVREKRKAVQKTDYI